MSAAEGSASQSSSGTAAEQRVRAPASAWYALAVLVITLVVGTVDQSIFTLLIEPMRLDLSLSDTQIGLLKGVGLTLFAGLAVLPLGWLSDRYDRRLVLAGCVLLWSVATAVRGIAPSYALLFIGSIGLAVGEAGLNPITYTLIPDLFPRRQRALANGVYVLCGLFGSAVGMMLGGALISAVQAHKSVLPSGLQAMAVWQLTYLALAVLGLPVVLLAVSIRRVRRSQGADGASTASGSLAQAATQQPYGDFLRAHWRTLAVPVVGSGVASIGLSAVNLWIPVLAVRKFGVSPAELGQGIGLAALASMPLGMAVGLGAMRLMRALEPIVAVVRIQALSYLIMIPVAIALPFVSSPLQLYVLLALLIVPLIAAGVVAPNALQEVSPGHLRGRVVTTMTMGILLFQVIGPVLIGYLSDALKAVPAGLPYAVGAVLIAGNVLGTLILRAGEGSLARLAQDVRK